MSYKREKNMSFDKYDFFFKVLIPYQFETIRNFVTYNYTSHSLNYCLLNLASKGL